jgi:2-polyprenyl-3-methyl-5-hydroxy-6-metoxy-1,4-benzoquinol methylase
MNKPYSPLTGTSDTTLTDTFFCADIIKLYRNQLDIDVTLYFKGINNFYLYQCNQTGYRFYYPKGLDGDGQFYEAIQHRLGEEYYHKWKFENQMALDIIKPADKVLDIGCGIGNFLEKVKAAEVTGLELNEKAVEVCRQKGLNVVNEMIGDHALHKPLYYDVVCMFQVLEHIYDVKEFLEDSLKVLKTGGRLVIGVPNNEPYFQGYNKYATLNLPPHHMGLWNINVFEKTVGLFNLKIEKFTYDVKGSIRTHAVLRAKYIAKIKSTGGQYSFIEKLKIMALCFITIPGAIFKKITKGINGSLLATILVKM